MDVLQWRESYATGVEAIDLQHRGLLDIFNDLKSALGSDEEREAFGEAVEAMASYVDDHFKLEEDYMRKSAYPRLNAHRSRHRVFVRKVVELQRALRREDATRETLSESVSFLADWIVDHIMGEDRGYITHFREAGFMEPPS